MRIRDWSSTFALPISRSLAWFDEERIGSRCDFPGHGITQRHMLDHFILGEDDFRGDAEQARNLIDLPIIVVRFKNPVIEHSRMGRFFVNRRRSSQRDRERKRGDPLQHGHWGTSQPARYLSTR